MKKSMIQVGKLYWDHKKGLRRVLEIGEDRFGEITVDYAQISGSRKDPSTRTCAYGYPIHGCYLRSFQEWAQEIVAVEVGTIEFEMFLSTL